MKEFLVGAWAVVAAFMTIFAIVSVLLSLFFGSMEFLYWVITGDFFHIFDLSPREAW